MTKYVFKLFRCHNKNAIDKTRKVLKKTGPRCKGLQKYMIT